MMYSAAPCVQSCRHSQTSSRHLPCLRHSHAAWLHALAAHTVLGCARRHPRENSAHAAERLARSYDHSAAQGASAFQQGQRPVQYGLRAPSDC
eukprot:6015864-Prymnesium_polylepis.2